MIWCSVLHAHSRPWMDSAWMLCKWPSFHWHDSVSIAEFFEAGVRSRRSSEAQMFSKFPLPVYPVIRKLPVIATTMMTLFLKQTRQVSKHPWIFLVFQMNRPYYVRSLGLEWCVLCIQGCSFCRKYISSLSASCEGQNGSAWALLSLPPSNLQVHIIINITLLTCSNLLKLIWSRCTTKLRQIKIVTLPWSCR